MSYETDKQAYDRDGFLVVRAFLVGDELDTLQRELERYIRDVVPGLPDADAFYQDKSRPETLKQMQHMDCDSFFAEYTEHSQWKSLAEALIGEEAHCEGQEWFNKPPNTEHPTPPHQDNYYCNLVPPNVATLWLALDEVGEENGALRYVRGSHLRGRRPHARNNVLGFSQGITDYGPEDEAREFKALMKSGDVVAHHGWTIHRADPNQTTDRQRRSFAMVFRGASCQVDSEGLQRYEQDRATQHQAMGLKTE